MGLIKLGGSLKWAVITLWPVITFPLLYMQYEYVHSSYVLSLFWAIVWRWSEFIQQHDLIVFFQHSLMSVRKVSQYWMDSSHLTTCDLILRTFPCHEIPSGSWACDAIGCFFRRGLQKNPVTRLTLSHYRQSTSKYFQTHNQVHQGLVVSEFVHQTLWHFDI